MRGLAIRGGSSVFCGTTRVDLEGMMLSRGSGEKVVGYRLLYQRMLGVRFWLEKIA